MTTDKAKEQDSQPKYNLQICECDHWLSDHHEITKGEQKGRRPCCCSALPCSCSNYQQAEKWKRKP